MSEIHSLPVRGGSMDPSLSPLARMQHLAEELAAIYGTKAAASLLRETADHLENPDEI